MERNFETTKAVKAKIIEIMYGLSLTTCSIALRKEPIVRYNWFLAKDFVLNLGAPFSMEFSETESVFVLLGQTFAKSLFIVIDFPMT